MKISKLFHWLYATLMFLPIIFFLPSCIYYGFNEHAVNTETTVVTYVYESNEVNSEDDLVEYNIYSFNVLDKYCDDLFLDQNGYITFKLLTTLQMNDHQFIFDEGINYVQNLEPNIYLDLYYTGDIKIYFDEAAFNNGDEFAIINYYGSFECDCIVQLVEQEFINYTYLAYTDYNEIDEVVINESNTIPQQINRAWISIWNLPFFAWTHDSFISAPFTYISGLFGLAPSNPMNYLITWFVSISIIWLVFDFVMYVPNLAHRWLDRGALE